MIVTRRPTASYWLEGNSRSPQEAMVTGDCGGGREHGTFGNGSIEEPERSPVVSARSGKQPRILDEMDNPGKRKSCNGRWNCGAKSKSTETAHTGEARSRVRAT